MSDLGQYSANVWFQAVSLSYNTATLAELVHICASGICAEPDPGIVHRISQSDCFCHFHMGHVVHGYSFPVSLHGGANPFQG